MFFELLKWWYGSGWLDAWQGVGRSIDKVQKSFSISLLLKNLFAPWKQIITIPGKSIDEKFRASIDNLVSRAIGFFVRLLTLLAAVIAVVAVFIVSLVTALVWPLLPLAVIFFLIKAVTG